MCRGPPDLSKEAAGDAALLPDFTRAEIASSRPDLVIIHDKVYDAARFRWEHPGGAVFVSVFGGRDATLAFQSYHMRKFPFERMAPFLAGSLHGSEAPVDFCADHLALCAAVRPALAANGNGSFAPRHQRIKAAALCCAAVGVEVYAARVGRTFANAAALGVLFALIGLNVQHDANHGAIFKSGTLNAVAGLAQSWIGGSQLMWLQEHVVLHHLHTGDEAMDCDAQLAPALRGHGAAPWFPWMRFQAAYFVVLEAFYGVVPVFVSFAETVYGAHKFDARYAVSPLARRWALQSAAAHLVFYARFLYLPWRAAVAMNPAAPAAAYARELAKVAVTVGVGGGYLAFFFFLSHNFEGVKIVAGATADGAATYGAESSFLLQQAASSSNVGGAKLACLNGGLNYQIEHHLLPRVAHSHYPTIAPIVRAFVEKRGGAYVHYDTVSANLASVARHLGAFADPKHGAAAPKPGLAAGSRPRLSPQ